MFTHDCTSQRNLIKLPQRGGFHDTFAAFASEMTYSHLVVLMYTPVQQTGQDVPSDIDSCCYGQQITISMSVIITSFPPPPPHPHLQI